MRTQRGACSAIAGIVCVLAFCAHAAPVVVNPAVTNEGAQVRASFKAPSMRLNKCRISGSAKYWVNGNIVLDMSSTKDVKSPVVRVVMLLDCGSRMAVMDAVACDPKGRYAHSGVPILSYGMGKGRWHIDLQKGLRIFFLEELSYYQRLCGIASSKGVEYFDRAKMMTGGFRIPDKLLLPDVAPKLVAYRLECWQNGALACEYNSLRPETLNSRQLPVDWYVPDRHPDRFDYVTTKYGN